MPQKNKTANLLLRGGGSDERREQIVEERTTLCYPKKEKLSPTENKL